MQVIANWRLPWLSLLSSVALDALKFLFLSTASWYGSMGCLTIAVNIHLTCIAEGVALGGSYQRRKVEGPTWKQQPSVHSKVHCTCTGSITRSNCLSVCSFQQTAWLIRLWIFPTTSRESLSHRLDCDLYNLPSLQPFLCWMKPSLITSQPQY